MMTCSVVCNPVTIAPVLLVQVLRDEQLDRLVQQIIRSVTKDFPRLRVGENDRAVFVHDQKRIRASFNKQLKKIFG